MPVAHLRKLYGRSVMADVLQNAVNEANQKIVADNNLKLALEPKIEFPGEQSVVERALDAKDDVSFNVALEVLPTFELVDLSDVSLTKLVAKPSDAEVDEAITRMATPEPLLHAPKDEGAAAETGDRVTIDFVGRIDGTEFEGGKGEGIDLELGSGSFIPGFEEQLVGAKVGDQRVVKSTFPESYGAEHLAGKDAEFDVTVTAIQAPGETKIDDELAKGFGMESLEKLKEAVSTAIGSDFEAQSRRKLKKELLDALDTQVRLRPAPEPRPPGIRCRLGPGRAGPEDPRARPSRTRAPPRRRPTAEYRKIAERRVRLGLVLAQVGETADIKVTDDEVNQALIARVRQYPGPGAAGLGLLPEEPAGAGRAPCADLRGEGRRPRPRAGEARRGAGLEGGAVRRRGRAERQAKPRCGPTSPLGRNDEACPPSPRPIEPDAPDEGRRAVE